VDDERAVDDIERAVGVGERCAVADVELETIRDRELRPGDDGRGEDLRAAIETDD
jgi:hypothetical protein